MEILITTLEILYLVIIILMTAQAIFNIRLRLFIWEKPELAWHNSAPTIYREPHFSFTIMLPARHEEDVYRETIQKVYDLNYPKHLIQILAICREDDPGTIAEARTKINQLRSPNVQLVIFNDKPINKPHGLNLGLKVAQGDIVTIFDTEDEPHPDILNIINTTYLNEGVDVIQSGVQLMNHNTKWFCFLNVLEYFYWFKSSLHFFARVGMTPLGGNTVFVRRALMEQLGGWDETCLTEDADLGIRLCLSKARVRIIYDDEFVTREETPHTIEQFIKQRTRWNQGFIQILFRGKWRQLKKLDQRMLALYVLILPEVQAFFSLLIPVSLVMMFFYADLHEQEGPTGKVYPRAQIYWNVVLDSDIRFNILHDNWQTIDYIILDAQMQKDIRTRPSDTFLIDQALHHATLVQTFNNGNHDPSAAVQIYQVEHLAP